MESPEKQLARWVAKEFPHIEQRKYQLEAWQSLQDTRAAGKDRALLQLATGLGKTSTAIVDVLHFIREEKKLTNPRIMFVSHMTDLNRQAQKSFLAFDSTLTTAFYDADHRRLNKRVNVLFATFQGVVRHLNKFLPTDSDYIIYDEAHHSEAQSFKVVRNYFKPTFTLGLTATPQRADGLHVFEYFGDPVYTKGMAEGIGEGWLSAVDYHIVFDEAIKKAMKDGFQLNTIKEIRELFAIRSRNEVIAKEVLQRRKAIGLDVAKTIVFTQDINAAEEMAKLLGGAVYHSELSVQNRQKTLGKFKSGDISVISTVDMFNEGVDIPDARLVVFLRSTSSQTIFEQQLGRGLRRAPGKDTVTVLDFVANVDRIKFVRNLGHTVSQINSETMADATISGRSLAQNHDLGDVLPKSHSAIRPSVILSNFDFEDESIQLLERYNAIKNRVPVSTEAVVAAYKKLNNCVQVGKLLGISDVSVKKHLVKAGVQLSSHFRNDITDEAVAEAYYRLKSAYKAGAELGISPWTVRDRLKRGGYKTIQHYPSTRATDEEVLHAYERNGRNQRATAREFGFDRNVLRKRLNRMGVETTRKSKQPLINSLDLAKIYVSCEGDISKMMQAGRYINWVSLYKALDEYGYVEGYSGPVTTARAAAAVYKYGNFSEAARILGVSDTNIHRLIKNARFLKRAKSKKQ